MIIATPSLPPKTVFNKLIDIILFIENITTSKENNRETIESEITKTITNCKTLSEKTTLFCELASFVILWILLKENKVYENAFNESKNKLISTKSSSLFHIINDFLLSFQNDLGTDQVPEEMKENILKANALLLIITDAYKKPSCSKFYFGIPCPINPKENIIESFQLFARKILPCSISTIEPHPDMRQKDQERFKKYKDIFSGSFQDFIATLNDCNPQINGEPFFCYMSKQRKPSKRGTGPIEIIDRIGDCLGIKEPTTDIQKQTYYSMKSPASKKTTTPTNSPTTTNKDTNLLFPKAQELRHVTGGLSTGGPPTPKSPSKRPHSQATETIKSPLSPASKRQKTGSKKLTGPKTTTPTHSPTTNGKQSLLSSPPVQKKLRPGSPPTSPSKRGRDQVTQTEKSEDTYKKSKTDKKITELEKQHHTTETLMNHFQKPIQQNDWDKVLMLSEEIALSIPFTQSMTNPDEIDFTCPALSIWKEIESKLTSESKKALFNKLVERLKTKKEKYPDESTKNSYFVCLTILFIHLRPQQVSFSHIERKGESQSNTSVLSQHIKNHSNTYLHIVFSYMSKHLPAKDSVPEMISIFNALLINSDPNNTDIQKCKKILIDTIKELDTPQKQSLKTHFKHALTTLAQWAKTQVLDKIDKLLDIYKEISESENPKTLVTDHLLTIILFNLTINSPRTDFEKFLNDFSDDPSETLHNIQDLTHEKSTQLLEGTFKKCIQIGHICENLIPFIRLLICNVENHDEIIIKTKIMLLNRIHLDIKK